ncbi:hypothetical protein J4E81_007604 [Alternaria sp. BMP 2799]|nr:hypothetical protein J4E80_008638 [Alternaria sp. BMP 0032]KAI4690450.1 hypothetical protein J4E81_007604 [Alternaria sp. BMP 2799]
MSLESLVLTASPFAVSNARDTIYALLYLANDMQQVIDTSSGSQLRQIFAPDYLKHPIDIFKDFVRYSIAKSKSLDVLYRQWASWSQLTPQHDYHERVLPSWIGVANVDEVLPDHQRDAPLDGFLGPVGSQTYHASQGIDFQKQAIPSIIDDIIQPNGILLGTVEMISSSAVHKGFLENDWLKMLGWRGSLDKGIDDRLWRTLVANRNPDAKTAPTWYRRACALALTQLDGNGNLASEALSVSEQLSTLINYLRRVQEATANRKIFRCASSDLDVSSMSAHKTTSEGIVGLGPKDMSLKDENLLCILYGSSVPVILRVIPGPNLQDDHTLHVKLVGPCYAHGHMEGEIFAGMSETEIKKRTIKFSIH